MCKNWVQNFNIDNYPCVVLEMACITIAWHYQNKFMHLRLVMETMLWNFISFILKVPTLVLDYTTLHGRLRLQLAFTKVLSKAFASHNQCWIGIAILYCSGNHIRILHIFDTNKICVFKDVFVLDAIQVYIPSKNLHSYVKSSQYKYGSRMILIK